MQVTTQVGVPTVFAAVLLWFVLFRVGNTLEVIQKQEEERTTIVADTQKAFVDALDRQTAAFERAIRDNIEANKALAAQYQRPGGPPR